jgi:chlorobactene glucosyltransferase
VYLILLALPWIVVLGFLLLFVRLPRELPAALPSGEAPPLVSVIVPARNEAVNIMTCVTSLVSSTYPNFEVIVVDDRSEDGTGALARAVGPGNARRLVVVEGAELSEGWLGKPWACWQGARQAEGELLLFTDADTTHGPELLGRAVAGLGEDGADLLTVLGRQLMETFWERLVQPQIFLTMLFRFPDFERVARNDNWRDAIANGQFILITREAYEAVGGHEAVHDEVVEDMALAQLVKRKGRALRVRSAEDDLATRMYRSLEELVAGWTKNIVTGGLQSLPRALRPLMAPLSLLTGVGLWLAPPLVLIAALAGVGGSGLLLWAATVYALSAVIWTVFTHQMHAPARYGLLYPIGAALGTYIFIRSWVRGRDVEWKGRRYRLRPVNERP